MRSNGIKHHKVTSIGNPSMIQFKSKTIHIAHNVTASDVFGCSRPLTSTDVKSAKSIFYEPIPRNPQPKARNQAITIDDFTDNRHTRQGNRKAQT
jgi:hypothetical protein